MSADPAHNDEFYLRYYVGHKGRFGHEFMVCLAGLVKLFKMLPLSLRLTLVSLSLVRNLNSALVDNYDTLTIPITRTIP
jgi:hypothetical protein